MRSKRTNYLFASVAAAAAVSAGIVGGAAMASDSADTDTTMMPPPPLLKEDSLPSERFKIDTGVTPDGRSYGSGVDVFRNGKELDLISAIGDSGLKGYVDRAALEGLADDVLPKDTDAYKDRMERGEVKVPVYAEDGKTRIDWFTLGDRDVDF